MKSDDSLGYTLLPLAEVAEGGALDLDLPLMGDGEGGARIQLTLAYSPFTGALPRQYHLL
jgi:hypothetical protein